jgi:hypothetical protein
MASVVQSLEFQATVPETKSFILHKLVVEGGPSKVNITAFSLLLSFWTLSIVRISTNQKTQRFGNWICFRLLVCRNPDDGQSPEAY